MNIVLKQLDQLGCVLVANTVVAVPDEYGRVQHKSANMLPVSAARVSYGRESATGEDSHKDAALMSYLARHQHFSPFEHQSATFLVDAPLYVAREWMRHRTQAFNEISMRYTSTPHNTFYLPSVFRAQSTSNKQSSCGVAEDQDKAKQAYVSALQSSVVAYNELLSAGVARELARGVLPTSMITRFYATANLRNWAHWYKLRSTDHAQEEIRHYADHVSTALRGLWPDAWGELL